MPPFASSKVHAFRLLRLSRFNEFRGHDIFVGYIICPTHVLRIVVIWKGVCLEVSYLNGTAARNASVFDALKTSLKTLFYTAEKLKQVGHLIFAVNLSISPLSKEEHCFLRFREMKLQAALLLLQAFDLFQARALWRVGEMHK